MLPWRLPSILRADVLLTAALSITRDAKKLYIGCASANQVEVFNKPAKQPSAVFPCRQPSRAWRFHPTNPACT